MTLSSNFGQSPNHFRVLFVIRSLGTGGAERQLVNLARGLASRGHPVAVATFYDKGALSAELESASGVQLYSLGKRSRWDLLRVAVGLHRVARGFRPSVIHSYMAGANEFALFTAKLLRSRIVWGIRASALDYKDYDRVSAITFRVGAALSRFVDLIIVNSHSGRNHYVEHNYRPTRTEVVPNGINTNEFCIDHQGGARFRKELGVLEGEVLIGIVGRLDPMKDHKNFLKAAALVAANLPGARFVCVGNGLEELPNALAALVPSLDPIPKIEWLGGRTDMRAVYNGLDLLVSSSAYGEGFSNAIGEGMACGVPCVSTDVGDSARIIGDTRRIVPPGDHSALARACLSTIASISTDASLDPINIRQRILDNYDEERLVDRTETLLGELVNDV